MSDYSLHKPVLIEEIILHLDQQFNAQWSDKIIVDGTFGGGGYSRQFLSKGASVIGIDRDASAIAIGQDLKKHYPQKLRLINDCFANIEQLDLPQHVDAIILDIGVSSMQIDQAERGFSFQKDGPLDMRMGQGDLKAADIVNNYSAEDLAKIFYYYGEEKYSRQIARMIVEKRQKKPFTTTLQLSRAIVELVPKKYYQKIHPATRVFQALRIYVNNELAELVKVLHSSERLLREGGILALVTFHSLEDRIVKQFLVQRAMQKKVSRYLPEINNQDLSFRLVTRKAVKASEKECEINVRARSAKLRIAIRSSAPVMHLEPEKSLFYFPSLDSKSKI